MSAGCGVQEPAALIPTPRDMVASSTMRELSGPIIYQPEFVWNGADSSFQGTGFFVRAPGERIAAVTSAHFLDRNGPRLLEARWRSVTTDEPVATMTECWGQPGHAGTDDKDTDLRADYLVLPASNTISKDLALELDPRPSPELGERVWFPDKDPSSPIGYRLLTGMVQEANVNYSVVVLDDEIVLQSQSGSPFISQLTRKVIGTLSRARRTEKKTLLLLAPSHAILDALSSPPPFPELQSVIGN